MSKKKKEYWGKLHEKAIEDYLNENTSKRDKEKLFEDIINPALLDLIEGVSSMPKFHHLYYITKEQLKDGAYETVIEGLDKFKPGRLGKNGYPVKAYSYYGTIAKNKMIFLNRRAKEIGQLFIYDFDISYQGRVDPGTSDLQDLLNHYMDRINYLLKNVEMEDDMLYFIVGIKSIIKKWNEVEFKKDSNGGEKLNLKEFRDYLSKELSIDRKLISNKLKTFQNLISEHNPTI